MTDPSSFPRRVAVLGCGGFIGSHLLDALLALSAVEVVGWDFETRRIEGLLDHPRLAFHHGDLLESPDALRRAIAGCDAVVSLAAICNPALYNTRPLSVIESNFLHAEPVVRFCAAERVRLIHLSTSEVYGRTLASALDDPRESKPGEVSAAGAQSARSAARGDDRHFYELNEDSTPLLLGPLHRMRWTYATAKMLLERLIAAHALESGLEYTIVRPFNFFGPRMDFLPGHDGEGIPRVLACFAKALIDGEPMRLVDGGVARRCFTFIPDAIEAILRILAHPETARNQVFNIGDPAAELSIAGLAGRMRETWAAIAADSRVLEHPIVEVSARDFYGEGYEDSDRRMPRIDKAIDRLGWSPRTEIDIMLRTTLQYFHDRYSSREGTEPFAAARETATLGIAAARQAGLHPTEDPRNR